MEGDEAIIAALRQGSEGASPSEALGLLATLGGEKLNQFAAVRILHAAFPPLPLHCAKEASYSRHIIGEGGLADVEIDALLSEYIPGVRA